MRSFILVLLLTTVVADDKPKKNADPRLKLKPHQWKTSGDDLAASLNGAVPKKGTWAEPIFGNKTEEQAPVAAAALEAREAAKAREQKSTSTTAKPAAKKVTIATTTTTTTTTTAAPKHKYWKPTNSTGVKLSNTSAVNFHNTGTLKVASNNTGTLKVASSAGAPSGPAAAMMKRVAGPAGPGAAPMPAPAPAPAPLTYEQKVAKLKGDMMKKIKSDSFDADLVIERPNKVEPGAKNAGKEHPVGEFKDVGSDFGPYAGAPGFAPAAKPLKHDDISFKTGSLPVDASHKNRETMTSDWHLEYGPNGPKGQHGARPQAGNFAPLDFR